jgi:glutamate dehydrogenase (NAD(P)+)
VYDYKALTGSVVGFPGSEPLTNGDLFSLDVDILCPSALENVITENNAASIRASIVAELANGPTTPEADDILFEKGVQVLPDILCNAGGVTVSYFEMVQNFSMLYWDEAEVFERLKKKWRQPITLFIMLLRSIRLTCAREPTWLRSKELPTPWSCAAGFSACR